MLNNNVLKKIELKTKDFKYLASKKTLTYKEYMSLVCTDEWQREFNKIINCLKSKDKDWY